jgi:hypothetical protein
MEYRVSPLLAIALILLAGSPISVHAQEEKLALSPPLSQVFPLTTTAEGIRLKYPVLLNDRTILKPDAILRFVYLDPNAGTRSRGGGGGGTPGAGGGQGGGHGHHHGGGGGGGGGSSDGDDAGGAYARGAPSPSSTDAAPPPESKGDSKDSATEIQTEVWTQASLFHDAFDEAAEAGTTVVYLMPGKQKPQSVQIDLPDGMFLGEIGGHVQVLGLTEDSRAGESGVRPGDEIRSFEGHLPVASLGEFLRVYHSVTESAAKADRSYAIEVWRPSDAKLETIQVAAPPSLHSLL